MTFHIQLRMERAKKGLTQERIAEKLNIKRSTYAKYETGENQPDYDMLKKMADFFGVSSDYLLGINTNDVTDQKEFNPLGEINDYIKEIGIDSIGFFDIEDWKNLNEEDIADIKKHFDWIAHKAKTRRKKLDM